jgi:hypothetical protein
MAMKYLCVALSTYFFMCYYSTFFVLLQPTGSQTGTSPATSFHPGPSQPSSSQPGPSQASSSQATQIGTRGASHAATSGTRGRPQAATRGAMGTITGCYKGNREAATPVVWEQLLKYLNHVNL